MYGYSFSCMPCVYRYTCMCLPQCINLLVANECLHLRLLNYLSILKSNNMNRQCLCFGSFTHLPREPHICVSELGQHWFRSWSVAYSAPSHYPNQCCVIVYWAVRNKRNWNSNRNSYIFVHGYASKMSFAKWRLFVWGWGWVGVGVS